jgi:haloalkane dehalogenase
MNISDKYPYEKKYKTIQGKRMAYMEHGEGDPIVFLHGNPTSSYLWRNIMPHMEGQGRLIAPDLIGMGDSEKLSDSGPKSYSYFEQRSYLFELLEALNVKENVTVVLHDWGSGLGFHWAHQHPERIKGIVFMEAIVAPMPNWDEFPENAKGVFQGFRSPAGENMVLEKNLFVEGVLPGAVIRDLTKAEMDEYRRPYLDAGESRRPTLSWPRALPFEGTPKDVVDIVADYGAWLSENNIPKLFINAEPGTILIGSARDLVRLCPNLTEVTVAGLHYIQEDSPHEIGEAISDWLEKI